jgi:hypothetical protein
MPDTTGASTIYSITTAAEQSGRATPFSIECHPGSSTS